LLIDFEDGLTYTQAFDAASSPKGENRLVSVTVNNQTTQFVYNGDGNPSTIAQDRPAQEDRAG
jgi:YD repeat-containing protein